MINEGGSKVILDFSGIAVISSSFADEFIGKLVVKYGFFNFQNIITLQGMNPIIYITAIADIANEVADIANEVADIANEVADIANEVADIANEVADIANALAKPAVGIADIANEVVDIANAIALQKTSKTKRRR